MLKQADALWRAATYVSVALLHLDGNVLLADPLEAEHVKWRPSGHWGTVPGTAWALAHMALAAGEVAPGREVVPVLGAGHAGVVQLAFAWLTGELARLRPLYSCDADGLAMLARDFPEVDGLGSEVHPLMWAGAAPGGCLGGALAFSHGLAMDVPGRVVMPVIGDGECETPTTAASWLASRALHDSVVVPVVHVNGFRMGARSLLGAMDDAQLIAYAAGLGWRSHVVHVASGAHDEHRAFHTALLEAVEQSVEGVRTTMFLRCVKGWSGPEVVSGRRVLGTSHAHKTPLAGVRDEDRQRRQLEEWFASYRPSELFDADGGPVGDLADALRVIRCHSADQPAASPQPGSLPRTPRSNRFGPAVTAVLRSHAAAGDFRVFSPDELASNHLADLQDEPWVSEVLAEEVLLGWLSGWTVSGRRGVLVSYEAFSPLLTAGIVGHLKHRRLAAGTPAPSLNLLLTSYGWHNVYTHGDPSLATVLLAAGDPAVRVLTPADPWRAAVALDESLGSVGRVNVLIAGKHAMTNHLEDTIAEEQARGLAVWPHLSDGGEPDLTILVAGDLPAQVTAASLPAIRERLGCRIRVVGVMDLTVLGDPSIWPRGLSQANLSQYVGPHAAVLVVTLGHPAAVWGLLGGRLQRSVDVVGWREPAGPMPQSVLAGELGLDPAGLILAASRLLARRREEVR